MSLQGAGGRLSREEQVAAQAGLLWRALRNEGSKNGRRKEGGYVATVDLVKLGKGVWGARNWSDIDDSIDFLAPMVSYLRQVGSFNGRPRLGRSHRTLVYSYWVSLQLRSPKPGQVIVLDEPLSTDAQPEVEVSYACWGCKKIFKSKNSRAAHCQSCKLYAAWKIENGGSAAEQRGVAAKATEKSRQERREAALPDTRSSAEEMRNILAVPPTHTPKAHYQKLQQVEKKVAELEAVLLRMKRARRANTPDAIATIFREIDGWTP